MSNDARERCKHCISIPVGEDCTWVDCCGAYSNAKRKDGLHWSHYPECTEANCPIVFPELLDGAIIETEDNL